MWLWEALNRANVGNVNVTKIDTGMNAGLALSPETAKTEQTQYKMYIEVQFSTVICIMCSIGCVENFCFGSCGSYVAFNDRII